MSILQIKKRKDGVKSGMSSLLTVICALLVEIIFFSWRSEYFLNVRNFLNIGLYAAIVGCISCSVTFINISGNIDLLLALRSLLSAWWLHWFPVLVPAGMSQCWLAWQPACCAV